MFADPLCLGHEQTTFFYLFIYCVIENMQTGYKASEVLILIKHLPQLVVGVGLGWKWESVMVSTLLK